ncbi:MAG: Crp/Fnr family transcriptional regulator [Ruminococcaceae bacterium]|nr:Crp/Fnr family transcriptional regulator [Oscillospiraceae bacterium]
MNKYIDVLRICPLFRDIADENLLRMLTCLGARVEFFDKKYTIMAEGNPAKFIGIVLSGSVQMINTDFYGNRSIVAVSEKGEMFCEAFACAEDKSIPLSVIASEPSEIMLINVSHILHTCENNCGFHQQLIFNLMKNLAIKNIQFHQKIEVTSKRSTREKLLAYLMICEQKAGKNSFEIPFDRQELADYLGVERSGLSAEIGKLKKEGIIYTDKKFFEIL